MPSLRADLVKVILFRMAAYPLYETCLDTDGFAGLFNELTLLACADRIDIDRLEKEEPWMLKEALEAQHERISAQLKRMDNDITDGDA